jgi:hypothetical protein
MECSFFTYSIAARSVTSRNTLVRGGIMGCGVGTCVSCGRNGTKRGTLRLSEKFAAEYAFCARERSNNKDLWWGLLEEVGSSWQDRKRAGESTAQQADRASPSCPGPSAPETGAAAPQQLAPDRSTRNEELAPRAGTRCHLRRRTSRCNCRARHSRKPSQFGAFEVQQPSALSRAFQSTARI